MFWVAWENFFPVRELGGKLNNYFLSRSRGEQSGAGSGLTTKPVAAFVGSDFDFSDRSLNVLQDDRPGIKVERIQSLAELDLAGDGISRELRLLVVSQSHSEDLINNSDRYWSAIPESACLVFAYDDPAIARNVREKMPRSDGPCRLRFLPNRASIDAWLCYVNAFLLRERMIPEEIVSAGQSSPGPEPESEAATMAVRLTQREIEVLSSLSEGLRNKTIAGKLGLSEHTVKLHLHNAFSKIGVDNRAHATAWFLANQNHIVTRDGVRP